MSAREQKFDRIATPLDVAARFAVSRETIEKLEAYAQILRLWQKSINLVSPATLDDLWHRHFADSAQLVALAPPAARTWLDLGSGAGFPGMVVAMLKAGDPGFAMTLLESDQRKAAFLREVARQTGTRVDIVSIRIEQAATQFNVPPADVVSARALAPLSRLLGLAAPFLEDASVGLFPKGRDVEAEIREARRIWTFDCALVPSLTDEDARIAVIRRLGAEREVEP